MSIKDDEEAIYGEGSATNPTPTPGPTPTPTNDDDPVAPVLTPLEEYTALGYRGQASADRQAIAHPDANHPHFLHKNEIYCVAPILSEAVRMGFEFPWQKFTSAGGLRLRAHGQYVQGVALYNQMFDEFSTTFLDYVKGNRNLPIIFHQNGFDTSPGSYIVENIQEIRHSCEPNMAWSIYGELDKLALSAIKDVGPEDPFTISYIQDCSVTPVEARAATLLLEFEIVCECDRCIREREAPSDDDDDDDIPPAISAAERESFIPYSNGPKLSESLTAHTNSKEIITDALGQFTFSRR